MLIKTKKLQQGVARLQRVFGLEIVPMPNGLKGSNYLYEHSQARAEDLMTAFKDTSVKGIFSNIGGEDSIRLLPYIDFDVIRKKPEIFMSYSDVTVSHLFCHKAGLSSFYGSAILKDFTENMEMDSYTIGMLKRILFSNKAIDEIKPAKNWTSDRLECDEVNKKGRRTTQSNTGYEVLQGSGVI
ncbi:LD-carboxypeptidase [Sporosarcina sp. FSL K6-1508]|uniref:LD-carboxypeptidase n=1 Tax=Sporosarcina sp. FSL K6-1508 TaxID=2921553 RepID=UPI0030FA67B5